MLTSSGNPNHREGIAVNHKRIILSKIRKDVFLPPANVKYETASRIANRKGRKIDNQGSIGVSATKISKIYSLRERGKCINFSR